MSKRSEIEPIADKFPRSWKFLGKVIFSTDHYIFSCYNLSVKGERRHCNGRYAPEIFVDGITGMQIDNLNHFMGTARKAVQTQYHPKENELFYRTFEVAQISGDEYVGSVLREDLTGILHDIRKTHPKSTQEKTTMSALAPIEDFQKNVQSVIEGKGSHEEQVAKAYLTTFGIDYDSLTPEEFVVLIGILKKPKFAKIVLAGAEGKRLRHRKRA